MCIPGLCEASTDVRRGESLIYGEVNASLMLMNFKPSDLPMALCENIAIFRRNIPCPWNMLQDRLIPGIVDGYRKVLGRVCIKAQSGIFCLQRRTNNGYGAHPKVGQRGPPDPCGRSASEFKKIRQYSPLYLPGPDDQSKHRKVNRMTNQLASCNPDFWSVAHHCWPLSFACNPYRGNFEEIRQGNLLYAVFSTTRNQQ